MTNISWQKHAMLKGSVATAAVTVAMLAGPAAFAQTTAATEVAEAETIVVTGSLIRNPNLDRSSPVTVTSAEEIDLKQVNTAEALLRDIPGLVPSIGSAVNNGNGGASFVDLRGLGSNRNIVLLDGNRLTPAELNGRFDLNNIPLALVDRVDVLTGGASTTYGADAISGVVNFITKQDFAGVEASGGYGLTQKGDGQTLRVDLVMGANFDDGRGNVTLALGYQEADAVLQDDRDFSRFSYTSTGTAGGTAGGSGTSDPSRFSGVNPSAGNLIANPTEEGAPQICNVPSDPKLPVIPGAPNCSNPQGSQRQITRDGTAFRAGTAFDSFNFNPYNVFQTPFKRFNIYSTGRYEVNENLEFYARGLFSKNKVQTIIAPSGAFGLTVNLPLNNPFLTTAQRNAFCNRDINPGIGYTPLFTASECAAAANPNLAPGDADYRQLQRNGAPLLDVNGNQVVNEDGEPQFIDTRTTLSRRNTEGGPRISTYDTTYFDYRAGLRGAITSTIDYDISGSYGESENKAAADGYWLNSRTQQSLMANGAGCFDATNGCVPLNAFGATGSITPDMNDFLNEKSVTTNKFTLTQARGAISGDVGVSSPWAPNPMAFAIGAEYRKYTAEQESDLLAQSGDLGGSGGAAPNISGGFEVSEIYGEVVIPLVQDVAFFEDLTLEGGARYSSYSVDAPSSPSYTTWTWKVGGSWAPGAGLKFRANYSRSVRAPNIAELFSPVNTGLTNLDDDPCASLNDDGTPIAGRGSPTGELLAICLAQGAPPSTIGSISVPTAGQANATFGGNLDLQPEKSTSWSVGGIWQPTFAPGLSLTVDYYNIVVTDAITELTPGDGITACFGDNPQTPAAGSSLTEACTIIRRGPQGSLSGDSQEVPGLYLRTSNQGRLATDGVDFSLNYGHDFGTVGWDIAVTGNWTNKSTFQAAPGLIDRDCVGKFGANCGSIQPDWQFSVRNTLAIGDFDLSLLWRHLTAVSYEGVGAFEGTLVGGNLAGQEANFSEIPAYNMFDLSARFNVDENFSFTFAISNLFNTEPHVVGNTIGSTSFNSGNVYPSTYDALGRRFNVGARLRF